MSHRELVAVSCLLWVTRCELLLWLGLIVGKHNIHFKT